jgi:hypothetical protein
MFSPLALVLFALIVRAAGRVMDQRDKAAPAIAVIYLGRVHLYINCAAEMPLWV